jgi:hypothetical protein
MYTPMQATKAIDARGNRFNVLSARDTTVTKPGRVALWTKADSVTAFDAITIDPLP